MTTDDELKHKYIKVLEDNNAMSLEVTTVGDQLAKAAMVMANAAEYAEALRAEAEVLQDQLAKAGGIKSLERRFKLEAENRTLRSEVAALRASLPSAGDDGAPKRSHRNANPATPAGTLTAASSSASIAPVASKGSSAASMSPKPSAPKRVKLDISRITADVYEQEIDKHVVRAGSGPSRKVSCLYCNGSINTAPGTGRREWRRHMRICNVCPLAVKALFAVTEKNSVSSPVVKPATPVLGVSASSFYSVASAHAGELSARADVDSSVATPATEGEAFEEGHESKPLISEPYRENSGEETAKPVFVKPMARKQLGFKQFTSTALPRHSIAAAGHHDAASASYTDLKPYPVEPSPTLIDGTPNTEGYRAWSDVIRFQIPSYPIVKATGLKATSFKRLHRMPELKVLPYGASPIDKYAHFAIPESMQHEFLLHVLGRDKKV
ncbi:hypothetical protein BC830DRAFT_1147376 [Chytriomyces sp. MP71]|nr:hypothetical protein BC830DRAFT_1147376 [Chytriomyces sp. MP71]